MQPKGCKQASPHRIADASATSYIPIRPIDARIFRPVTNLLHTRLELNGKSSKRKGDLLFIHTYT